MKQLKRNGRPPCLAWLSAKDNGDLFYETGKPCKRGHIAPRRTSSRDCIICVAENNKKRADQIRKTGREWYTRNRKSRLEYGERNRERKREYSREHYRENKHQYMARSAERRARKASAMPSWADKDAIKEIYKTARLFSEMTGIEFHVDHIIPLQGKNVCGLHIAENLQILSQSQNLSKRNSFDAVTT